MILLWHNPKCSKSRQVLALLRKTGHEFHERRYLENAPTRAEIETALSLLRVRPIGMMRPNETLFKELGLTLDSQDTTLIEAMAHHPRLIERPILFANGRAIIGRPPETTLTIL